MNGKRALLSERGAMFREAFTINGHSIIPPVGSDQSAITIR